MGVGQPTVMAGTTSSQRVKHPINRCGYGRNFLGSACKCLYFFILATNYFFTVGCLAHLFVSMWGRSAGSHGVTVVDMMGNLIEFDILLLFGLYRDLYY